MQVARNCINRFGDAAPDLVINGTALAVRVGDVEMGGVLRRWCDAALPGRDVANGTQAGREVSVLELRDAAGGSGQPLRDVGKLHERERGAGCPGSRLHDEAAMGPIGAEHEIRALNERAIDLAGAVANSLDTVTTSNSTRLSGHVITHESTNASTADRNGSVLGGVEQRGDTGSEKLFREG